MTILYRFRRQISTLFQSTKFAWQRAFRGYDDSAFWDLDVYLASIAAPILQKMVDSDPGYPPSLSPEEWSEMLQKMASAMKLISKGSNIYTKEEEALIDEATALFGKRFRDLWT